MTAISVDEYVEKLKPSYIAHKNLKWNSDFEKQLTISLESEM
jgi:hypothetical protein